MDTIDTIEQALPELRRYAYCLTGDLYVADDLALACLMRWAKRPTGKSCDRIALFKLFHMLPQLAELPARARSELQDEILERVLKLPLQERQVLILVVTMRFRYEDVAVILDTDVAEIRRLLARAREKLLDVPLRALVIEDETLVAMELADMLQERGMRVLGPVASKASAIRLVERSPVDLILADVSLAGADDGIETVKAIRALHRSAVVYVTAYPDRVRGDVDHTQVVSKPFCAETIDAAVTRAFAAQLAA